MKCLCLLSISVLLVISCRKEISLQSTAPTYLQQVESRLKDSLTFNDFSRLNLKKATITKGLHDTFYCKIPLNTHQGSNQFVLLQTYSNGSVRSGVIIYLEKVVSEQNKLKTYNGVAKIFYLNGTVKQQFRIVNGYIKQQKEKIGGANLFVVPSDSTDLPPVIVTCYIHTDVAAEVSAWLNYASLFGGAADSGSSGWYSSIDNGAASGTTNNYSYGTGAGYENPDTLLPGNGRDENFPAGITEEKTILVDFEPVENKAAIEVAKFIKCFNNIPDIGSTCTIEILCDIPVDSDPRKLLDWETESPGHTFLQLKKINGNNSITQNIGFYPEQGWKILLTNAPVPGKFVDNRNHEYNASLKMNLTPADFNKTLNHLTELSKLVKYDIDEYNCTDFALDVFNTTRFSNELIIPRYDIPGGMTTNGSNTPQGLYAKLVSMQQAGAEFPNITLTKEKRYVGASSGACN